MKEMINRKRLAAAVAAALLICMLVVGCGNKATETDPYADINPPLSQGSAQPVPDTTDEQAQNPPPDDTPQETEPLPDPEPEFAPAMSITDGKGVYYVYVDKNGVADPYMTLNAWHDMTAAVVDLPHISDEIALTHVQRVGSEQAEECTELPEEVKGAALIGIDDNSFYGCSLMTAVTMPETVEYIGDYAFAHCKLLETVILPEGLITLCDGAFYNCSALCEIIVPENVEAIGEQCFAGCTALAKAVLNCSGLTVIEDGTFDGCISLADVNIPDRVTDIGYRAFYNCSALEAIIFPSALQRLGDYAFCGSGLTSIALPEGLQSIGSHAFRGTNIGIDTFDGNIPKRVTTVGANPFADTPWMVPVRNDGGFLTLRSEYTFLVAYTLDSEEVYMFPGIDYICTGAFEGTSVESVIISEDVVEICSGAFRNCTDLKTVTMGINVKNIGDYAFFGCTELESITLNDGLQSIGYDAFWNCQSLESITLPESITFIDEFAFDNCPVAITCTDGSYAHSRCKELEIPIEENN